MYILSYSLFFFFNDTATTEIYTLSLHDALPIFSWIRGDVRPSVHALLGIPPDRSEEHTSELQSRENLVCRLLLEKKKKIKNKEERNNGTRQIYDNVKLLYI